MRSHYISPQSILPYYHFQYDYHINNLSTHIVHVYKWVTAVTFQLAFEGPGTVYHSVIYQLWESRLH